MSSPEVIIDRLHDVLGGDGRLAVRLELSIRKAHELARAKLDPDLFAALEWPLDLAGYEAYLKRFVRWVPQQSGGDAWKGQGGPADRYSKEVSDRLAHFFWLVDQEVGPKGGTIGKDSAAFRGWLTEFARQWGDFLDTTESFSQEILDTFIDYAPEYSIGESLVDGKPNMPSGWLTFNQFFARQLNAGLRPIAEPANNLIVTSPADCSFRHAYDIDGESNIPATTIKNNRTYGNIAELLEGSRYGESFAGGTFVHYMLPPSAYHRFHLPVSGLIRESFVIAGEVYLQVTLEGHQLDSKDSTTTGFEFAQTRGVVTIDTGDTGGDDIGVVAVVPVGMAHVGSVVLTALEDRPATKGDEFGYFQFGGSDIILLFQSGTDPQVDTSDDFRLVGTPVARCSRRPA
ncbi:phosphatidylserine decarboxylase [Rhodococcus sp. D2-41]|uniref:Phosphatidylserine decarboxylase n=1 Tax=Speluncibacter jeojiensis TaxID=2710754 RepID=A0A9X4RCI3_9ACTN|nr:phosphatidylserine decarboxylase [Rhodococcus sp. D2-41]MDG3010891.1 phosphatidylserine decarboxylase [Rhodococcus sp. D2-41]MDG3013865.1 phosphatidylserine decarboxylase [Corynebacteriales bacterium D3-21]